MNLYLRGMLWIGVYLAVTLAPLFVVLIGPDPPERDFWTEFSVALGFVGLAMMNLQFAITARFQGVAAPYGIDVIIQFHRQISYVALALVLAHPLILFARDPQMLNLLDPVNAPWRARAGTLSVVLLLALVALSVWRSKFKLGYEAWRISHGILAVLVVAFALAHIVLVGRYTAQPWKQILWIGMSVSTVAILAYVRVWKPLVMYRRPYRVAEVVAERGDSYTLVLEPEGHEGLKFRPGQFAWLTIQNSPFSVYENPFSFSTSALDQARLGLTIKAVGDFTSTVKNIPPGTRAYLDGPYGAFTTDRHEGPGFVLVAGGVGITPIMSILHTLEAREDVRPVTLVYAVKTLEAATFREELERLEMKLNMRLVFVVEQPPDDWQGERGFVNGEMLAKYLPAEPERREYFICGPPPMIDAVEKALVEQGVPPEKIHSEKFHFV